MPGNGKNAAPLAKELDIQGLFAGTQSEDELTLLGQGLDTFIQSVFFPAWENDADTADSAWKRPTKTKTPVIDIKTIDGTPYKLRLSHSIKLLFTPYQQQRLDEIAQAKRTIQNLELDLLEMFSLENNNPKQKKIYQNTIASLHKEIALNQQRIEIAKAEFYMDYDENGISFIVLPKKKAEKLKFANQQTSDFKGEGAYGKVIVCRLGGIVKPTEINIQHYKKPFVMKYSVRQLSKNKNFDDRISKLERKAQEEQRINNLMDTSGQLKNIGPIPLRIINNIDGSCTVKQYILMEYLPGENLHTLLEKNVALTPNQSLAIFSSIVLDIQRLLDHKKLHTDLKPGNIIITTKNGRLIDFAPDAVTRIFLPFNIRNISIPQTRDGRKEEEKIYAMLYAAGLILLNLVVPSIKPYILLSDPTAPFTKIVGHDEIDYDFSTLNDPKHRSLFHPSTTSEQQQFLANLINDLVTPEPSKIKTFADLTQRLIEGAVLFPDQSPNDYSTAFQALYGEAAEQLSPLPSKSSIMEDENSYQSNENRNNITMLEDEIAEKEENSVASLAINHEQSPHLEDEYYNNNGAENLPEPILQRVQGHNETYSFAEAERLLPGLLRQLPRKISNRQIAVYDIDPAQLDDLFHQRLIDALLLQGEPIFRQDQLYPCVLSQNNRYTVYLVRPLQTIIQFQRMKNGTPQVDDKGKPIFRYHTFDEKQSLAEGGFGTVYKTTSTLQQTIDFEGNTIAENKKDFKVRAIKRIKLNNINDQYSDIFTQEKKRLKKSAVRENTIGGKVGLKNKSLVKLPDPDNPNLNVYYSMMQFVPGNPLNKATPFNPDKNHPQTFKQCKDPDREYKLNTLPLPQRLQWSRSIIDDLRLRFHARGIFHGDVSDAQVLVYSEINQQHQTRAIARFTDCGMSANIGTPSLHPNGKTNWYYLKGRKKNAISDVFSLGILLIEVYAGTVHRANARGRFYPLSVASPAHSGEVFVIKSLFKFDHLSAKISPANKVRIQYALEHMLMRNPATCWNLDMVSDFFAFIEEQNQGNKPAFFNSDTHTFKDILLKQTNASPIETYKYVEKLDVVDRLLWCLRKPSKENREKLPAVIKSVLTSKKKDLSTLNGQLIACVMGYLKKHATSLSLNRISDCYELLVAARDIHVNSQLRLNIACIAANMKLGLQGYKGSDLGEALRNLLKKSSPPLPLNHGLAEELMHTKSRYLLIKECKAILKRDKKQGVRLRDRAHSLENDLLYNIIDYVSKHASSLSNQRFTDIKAILASIVAHKHDPIELKIQILSIVMKMNLGALNGSQLAKNILTTVNTYRLLKTDTLIVNENNRSFLADNLLTSAIISFKGHSLKRSELHLISSLFARDDSIGNAVRKSIEETIKSEKEYDAKYGGVAWRTLIAVLSYVNEDFNGSKRRANAIKEVLTAIQTFREDQKHGMDRVAYTYRFRETIRTIADKIKRQECGISRSSSLKSRLYGACYLLAAEPTALFEQKKKVAQQQVKEQLPEEEQQRAKQQLEQRQPQQLPSVRDRLKHGLMPSYQEKVQPSPHANLQQLRVRQYG